MGPVYVGIKRSFIMEESTYMVACIILEAKALCEKFILKVETGRARSVETYRECKHLLDSINKSMKQ